jgi:pilus assembly protein CpaB
VTRRSGWILLTLGVLLAIGAGALVYVVLQQQSVAAAEQARREVLAQQAPQIPTIKLPVAARALAPGNAVGPDDILLKDFPLDLVPVNALTETTEIENRILARAVGQGDPFQRSMFVGERGESVSQEIPPGYVLFAFPIVDLLGQSNLIEDGDRIDLYLTLNTPLDASAAPRPTRRQRRRPLSPCRMCRCSKCCARRRARVKPKRQPSLSSAPCAPKTQSF